MFNNAGVNKPDEFPRRDRGELEFHHGHQWSGCMIGMQEAARQMIAQGSGGKIINTASIASRQGFDNVAPYCASKWAVVSLTQSGARDLAKHDITVTGFAPGVVATEMWEQVDRDLMEIGAAERPGQAMEEFSADILRGRVAKPRGYHRHDDVSGVAGQRLHDRPDRHDRRRHDIGLTLARRAGRQAQALRNDRGRKKQWRHVESRHRTILARQGILIAFAVFIIGFTLANERSQPRQHHGRDPVLGHSGGDGAGRDLCCDQRQS